MQQDGDSSNSEDNDAYQSQIETTRQQINFSTRIMEEEKGAPLEIKPLPVIHTKKESTDFFLPDIKKNKYNGWLPNGNPPQKKLEGLAEDKKATIISSNSIITPNIGVGHFKDLKEGQNHKFIEEYDKTKNPPLDSSQLKETQKNDMTTVLDNTCRPMAGDLDRDNQEYIDPVFQDEADEEIEIKPKAMKTKNLNVYDINYYRDNDETLKEIYGVKYFLIFPDMRPKQFWDLFITVGIIILCFLVPWRLAFFEDNNTLSWFIADTIIDCFFTVDIVLNFFTVYTDEYENFVTDRRLIAFTYLRGWFLFDFVSILPLEYLIGDTRGLNELARLMRVLKMYKLVKIFRLVKQSGKIQKYAKEWLKISMIMERSIAFFFLITITTHVFACIWYFLSKWNDFGPDTWVYNTGLVDATNFNAYIYCCYFIIQVLTTVGYGDITIHSSTEKLLIMMIMLVGVIVFSFAFGSLVSALTNLDSRAAKLKERIFELNSLNKKYKLSTGLYQRLYKEIKFEKEQDINLESLVKTLPVVLRTELILAVNSVIINTINFFKTKDDQFCAAVASHLKSTNTAAGDYIYEEKDPILEIFFLLTGEAGYAITKDHVTIIYSKIVPGNLFGDLDMINTKGKRKENSRKFTVKAISNCEIISLKKESISELESDFPATIADIFYLVHYRREQLLKCRAVAKQKLDQELKIKLRKFQTEKKYLSNKLKRMDTKKIADFEADKVYEFDENSQRIYNINLYSRRRAIRLYHNMEKFKAHAIEIMDNYRKNNTQTSKLFQLLDQISLLIASKRKERNKKLEEAKERINKFKELMKMKMDAKQQEEEVRRKKEEEERRNLKEFGHEGYKTKEEVERRVKEIVVMRKVKAKYGSGGMDKWVSDKWNLQIV
ncbi:unnamed protein product [Moneuplotes crassus]|uniref:Cyclic nucleotide-binding domain-containing protein n=1 Tax=Euplotes crassus TaxID=5936 RepID=A0AAD1XPQ5_EUPCR|nr:unnamed protein product [Moneuplotes crassus]